MKSLNTFKKRDWILSESIISPPNIPIVREAMEDFYFLPFSNSALPFPPPSQAMSPPLGTSILWWSHMFLLLFWNETDMVAEKSLPFILGEQGELDSGLSTALPVPLERPHEYHQLQGIQRCPHNTMKDFLLLSPPSPDLTCSWSQRQHHLFTKG